MTHSVASQVAVENGSNMTQMYMSTLTSPKTNMSRIPDAESRPTCLFRSVYDMDINCQFNGNSDDGKFAVMAQPILGKDGLNPNTFKLALPVPGYQVKGTDWTNPASYQQNVGGLNVRMDRYIQQLTGTPSFFYGIKDGGATSSTQPLGTAPEFDPQNYGATFTFGEGSGTVTQTISGGAGVFNVVASYVNCFQEFTISGAATLTVLNTGYNTAAPASQAYAIDASGNWTLTLGSSGDPDTAMLVISPGAYQNIAPWENTGAITALRPVAMSLLFTSALSGLTDGGMVAAAYVPSGTCAQNWFANVTSNAVGQLQDWSNVAPLGYSGKIREGSYVWWSPEDVTNNEFRTPETANQTPYPCLMIAGQVSPGTAPVAGTTMLAGRLEIVTIYEATTNVMLWEMVSYSGNQVCIDWVMKWLSKQYHAMPNDAHVQWFRNLLSQAAKAVKEIGSFAYENRAVLIPLALKVASAVGI